MQNEKTRREIERLIQCNDISWLVVDGNGNETRQVGSARPQFPVQVLQAGQFFKARRAPRRPEVHDRTVGVTSHQREHGGSCLSGFVLNKRERGIHWKSGQLGIFSR